MPICTPLRLQAADGRQGTEGMEESQKKEAATALLHRTAAPMAEKSWCGSFSEKITTMGLNNAVFIIKGKIAPLYRLKGQNFIGKAAFHQRRRHIRLFIQ